MNRSGKGNHEVKLVRVPADLKRRFEEVAFRSRTVQANCPFGHDIEVAITVKYVPKGGPNLRLNAQILRKRVPPGPQLVQSTEPVSDEHFEALLGSPLRQTEKRFVTFFQKRRNVPTSPFQWMKVGFPKMTYVKAINSLCRRKRLGICFAETGEYDEGNDGSPDGMNYKFYLLESARRTRE